ncbi:hypothetical protein D3C85_1353330 [compost metagenome]
MLFQQINEDARRQHVALDVDVEYLVKSSVKLVQRNITQRNIAVPDSLGSDKCVQATIAGNDRLAARLKVCKLGGITLKQQWPIAQFCTEQIQLGCGDVHNCQLRTFG